MSAGDSTAPSISLFHGHTLSSLPSSTVIHSASANWHPTFPIRRTSLPRRSHSHQPPQPSPPLDCPRFPWSLNWSDSTPSPLIVLGGSLDGPELCTPSLGTAVAAVAAMHDFCFTYPYGFVVFLGGLIGFFAKGSTTSLLNGGGSGLLLLLAGYVSHQAYLKNSKSAVALVLETVVSLTLTWIMGQRFIATGKVMPAGMVAALSGIMAIFYLYKMATGGNHIVKKET